MSDVRRSAVCGPRRLMILWAVVLASVAFLLAGMDRPAFADTIVVNTTTDEDTSNASCSLREAIAAANTDAAYNGCTAGSGSDTIAFNIAGTALAVRTIALSNSLGALPSITTPVTIDGWAQGVFDGTAGYTGSPLVELSGANLTATSIGGLAVDSTSANGVTIQGLTLNRFKSSPSAAVKIQNGASNVTIKGNYIGLNNTGTPSLSVANAQVAEASGGTSTLTFTVTLSLATLQQVTVQYATSAGTAAGGASCGAGVDYVSVSGTLTFAPGATSKQVQVAVCGETVYEPNETLTLTLSSPTNAVLAQATATGTIANDDQMTSCTPRPPITIGQNVGGGRLQVRVVASSLNTGQANPIQQLQFGDFRNARVTLGGQPVSAHQAVSIPAGVTTIDFTVERIAAGQSATVPFTVVDGCGPWSTFVGGGTSAGF